jgi:hypothetical protein
MLEENQATLRELPNLAALRVSNAALRGDQLPTRLKVFNWGDNPSTKGTFRAGDTTARILELNQRALGFERVAIDYNHCTVPGSPEYIKGQPPAIFGYGTVRVKPNDGIYLEDVTWTPLGLQHARNFEDLSPALHPDQPGEDVDFLHSVALTTNGALHDVTFFSAAKSIHDQHMNNNTTPGQGILTLAIMASALGLAATATEAEVTSKIKTLSTLEPLVKDGKVILLDDLAALDARLKKIEEAGKVASLSAADLVPVSERLKKLEDALVQSSQASLDRERGALIARFAADGKVPRGADGKELSNDDLAKLDLATLQILHANTPATVPLHSRGKPAKDAQAGSELKGLAKTRAAFQAQFDAANRTL